MAERSVRISMISRVPKGRTMTLKGEKEGAPRENLVDARGMSNSRSRIDGSGLGTQRSLINGKR